MCVPIVFVRQGFVDAVVEVLVMGEDDMAADIVELIMISHWSMWIFPILTKPSFVTSVEARPPGISLESTMSHEGPF
jgi:hypothetical protein